MSKHALCVVYCVPMAEGCHSLWCRVAAVEDCLGDTLPLCLMVQSKFLLGLGLCACGPWSGIDVAGTWAAKILQYTATLRWAVGSESPSIFCHTTMDSGQW